MLKRFAPKSLYGRFLLIILVPAVAVQLVATYMFYARHWESITRNISATLGSEVALVLERLKGPPETRESIIRDARRFLKLEVDVKDRSVPTGVIGKPTQRFEELENALSEYVKDPFYVVDDAEKSSIILVVSARERQITITVPRKRLMNPTTYIYIMWLVGTGFILLIVSILFLRNQVRSIVRLSEAADRFGKGQEAANFKPQGALEVRQAAHAFLQMKERIRRQVQQRTEMLAGVSHDLRTPLTRMKLQLAMMKKSEETSALLHDVADMERMVEGYLEFVRSGEAERTEIQPLSDFIRQFGERYRAEKERIEIIVKDDTSLHLRPHALQRSMANVVDNALRYGQKVRITAGRIHDHVEIAVEDDGPGIPQEKRDSVFLPFVRLETSRNRETGGVGLGLAIARDIIHQHGGHITLGESVLGGLKVTIMLPL